MKLVYIQMLHDVTPNLGRLAACAGLNATDVVSALNAAHAAGQSNAGLDVETGEPKDLAAIDITDPHSVKWCVSFMAPCGHRSAAVPGAQQGRVVWARLLTCGSTFAFSHLTLFAGGQDPHRYADVREFDRVLIGIPSIFSLVTPRRWALRLAADAAVTVLKVDQIIMAKQAGGPKPRAPGAMDED